MNNEKKGDVYLIASGPGNPELITARGLELLQSCDAVLYDNLVPDELVISLPAEVEKYYVGKKAGTHEYSQNDITRLLLKLANEGKNAAHLEGCDPITIEPSSGEAEYLKESGIHFEVVPPATADDIEKDSLVIYATGERTVPNVRWQWLSDVKDGTVIMHTTFGEIANIVNGLIDRGISADTPASVVETSTSPTRHSFTSPLHQLPERVEKEGISPPAIFVIGQVADLREQLKWLEDRPLFGVRVMVTRPVDQAKDMYRTLRELGAEVLPYPTIGTEESSDEKGWRAFQRMDNKNRWLVFTSENGVKYFSKQFSERSGDVRRMSHFKIAAVGAATAHVLEEMNLQADFIPTEATAACLSRELPERIDLSGAGVVRVRGNLADESVEKALTEAGADVLALEVYRTFHPAWPDGFKEKLFDFPPDVITFTSGSSVDGLYRMLTDDEMKNLVKDKVIVSIGPSTSKVIRSHGLDITIEAGEHSVAGIIKELVKFYKRQT